MNIIINIVFTLCLIININNVESSFLSSNSLYSLPITTVLPPSPSTTPLPVIKGLRDDILIGIDQLESYFNQMAKIKINSYGPMDDLRDSLDDIQKGVRRTVNTMRKSINNYFLRLSVCNDKQHYNTKQNTKLTEASSGKKNNTN